MYKISKRRRILFCISLIPVLIVIIILCVMVTNKNKMILSEMKEQECINYIKDNGITIPAELNSNELGKTLKSVIKQTENYINQKVSYEDILKMNPTNYSVTSEFFIEVKKLVMKFYFRQIVRFKKSEELIKKLPWLFYY